MTDTLIRKLLVVELNEFDPDYLLKSAGVLGLENIKIALSYKHSTTTTDDEVEHQGLDPWVQWVNVHCGQPSSEHGILRLGQTKCQKLEQIWTKVGHKGFNWGVWGAMNAPKQDAPGCKFFFPDPWSFEEDAYPKELNKILSLPRYMAKNYLEVDKLRFLREAITFTSALVTPSMWKTSFSFTSEILAQVSRNGLSVHTLSTFLDYLSTMIFVSYRKKYDLDFSLIFLNNIAHLQHQFWKRGDEIHPEMKLGLKLTDKMLGLLFDSLDDDDALILLNGLKQRNVEGEGFCVYRQKNPDAFVEALGLSGKVQQCMTHDAHLLCDNLDQADLAEKVLSDCVLSTGEKLLDVERISDTIVFFQIAFEHEITSGTQIASGNKSIPLDEVIELYAKRTGAHIQSADVYAKNITVPHKLYNHAIHQIIDDHFHPDSVERE